MKKVCLFGGTFDPPHIGHLLVAQTVAEAENFEKIIFVLTYHPPFKNNFSPVEHRLSMLKMAIVGNPKFDISEIELKRRGISYTLDTIKAFKEEEKLTKDELYFLIGSDSLMDFSTWDRPREILNECKLLVAIRPGFRPSDVPIWVLKKVQFANIPRFEIASSTIRKRWEENKTIRYMVTQPVWEYINAHKLFSK
ncbi:MAG: nicotinate-nucleotide adenylyltransferase [Fidelibacterota bacterium]